MKLIVGLGNPGEEYNNTRHNFGFAALDNFSIAADFEKFLEQANFQSLINQGLINKEKIILAKPLTFMNNSGLSVAKLASFYKLKSSDLVIVYDDLDLPLGTIRCGLFKSSGGHNGLKSIIQNLGGNTDFYRIRLGIKNETSEKLSAEKIVLQRFTKFEEKTVEKVIKKTTDILKELLTKKTFDNATKTISVI